MSKPTWRKPPGVPPRRLFPLPAAVSPEEKTNANASPVLDFDAFLAPGRRVESLAGERGRAGVRGDGMGSGPLCPGRPARLEGVRSAPARVAAPSGRRR